MQCLSRVWYYLSVVMDFDFNIHNYMYKAHHITQHVAWVVLLFIYCRTLIDTPTNETDLVNILITDHSSRVHCELLSSPVLI